MLLCGLTGIGAAWLQSSALNGQSKASALLANHEEADMMHDAIRSDVLAAFQAQDPASGIKRADVEADFKEHLDTLRKRIAADGEYTGSAEVAAVTSKLVEPMNGYADGAKAIMEQIWQDPIAAKSHLNEFFAVFRTLETSMAEATDAITSNAEKSTAQAELIGRIAMGLLLVTLLAGIAGTVTLIRLVRSRVIQPIESLAGTMRKLGSGDLNADVTGADRGDELGDMAKAMLAFRDQLAAAEAAKQAQVQQIVTGFGAALGQLAGGDLTARIDAEMSGPFARLKSDFNDAATSLRDLIGSVTERAGNIRQGSSEIAQASEDLARRTETNASNLERAANALREIDERIKATARASATTVERADRTISVVGTGRSLAGEAVDSMSRVSASAEGIDAVIEGLDKIAFQTRVLAMNAAVEAGRAGEAGRGFAVVADLVSALAMRAEEESKRARDQLTVTQADIVSAVEAVRNVDGAFADISSNVDEVHALLERMASDNQAQSTAISELNTTVTTMDQSTQQNAAMVEETSAAARNLTDEAQQLDSEAGQFRVGNAQRRASPAPAPRAAKLPDLSARAVRPLPTAAVTALTPPAADDWTSF
ncbi:MAG: HAMP domain-containing protein [Sphingomonas sp.]|nr:HAMP domain-containing protein [Sphingomonas sp.]